MVPVVELRGTDEHAERSNRQADIRVNVDSPNAPKGDKARERCNGEANDAERQVGEEQGVNCIEWVFAVRGKPVQMFGTVVDGMEAPEEGDTVLEAMAPVDQQIARQHDLNDL
jgi:hypothetical protein